MTIDCAFYGLAVRDAELKTSQKGKPYARFTVRVGAGEGAQFVSVMYFGERADGLAEKLKKDCRVYVEGMINLDKWTTAEGVERHGLSVMSFHARLPAIGRNRQKKEKNGESNRG